MMIVVDPWLMMMTMHGYCLPDYKCFQLNDVKGWKVTQMIQVEAKHRGYLQHKLYKLPRNIKRLLYAFFRISFLSRSLPHINIYSLTEIAESLARIGAVDLDSLDNKLPPADNDALRSPGPISSNVILGSIVVFGRNKVLPARDKRRKPVGFRDRLGDDDDDDDVVPWRWIDVSCVVLL